MSKSTKRTIFIAVILIVLAIATLGVIVHQVTTNGQRLTEQLATLGEQQAQEASRLKLQRLAQETTAKRERLQEFFLRQESDSIDLLNHIETMAPAAGVTLQTNGLELIKEKDTEDEWIKAAFSFSGPRENVQNFIQILETLPYVLRVTDIEMKALSSTLWQANVTMQVRILKYDK